MKRRKDKKIKRAYFQIASKKKNEVLRADSAVTYFLLENHIQAYYKKGIMTDYSDKIV